MTEPLKVMHVVFSLETGGLENGVVNLCHGLDPEQFQPMICVFKSGGDLERRVDPSRVKLLAVHRWTNNDPTLPVRLAWQLRQHGVQLLHTHSWGTLLEGCLAARLARTPILVHGEHGSLETKTRHRLLQRYFWSRANRLTSVASPLADAMSEAVDIPREAIQVIPNGVDTDRFCPPDEGHRERRRRYGVSDETLFVGMVARLVPVKNHHGVFRALRLLLDEGLDIQLGLAGDGPLMADLQATAKQWRLSDRVHFLGNLSDVTELLGSLDIFVLNSHSEGMSNTVLEAMACGLPVVATAVGSTPDMVVDGVTGVLIPADDPPALHAALRTLAGDASLRERMGRLGRERIEAHYSIAKMVRDYSELYLQLAGKILPGRTASASRRSATPSASSARPGNHVMKTR